MVCTSEGGYLNVKSLPVIYILNEVNGLLSQIVGVHVWNRRLTKLGVHSSSCDCKHFIQGNDILT